MNRLITGVNKNGKTNFAVVEVDSWLAKFPDRVCFTNINGLSQTTDRCYELPESNDWRDTPAGSLIVYDEAQKFPWMEATGESGNSRDVRIKELATSAHENRDVWFITQNATLIHHHIRKFINEHIHLVRILGMQMSTKWTWHERVCIKPDDFHEQQKADKSVFAFRKDLYSRYVASTDGHNVPVRLPRKVLIVGSIAVLGVVLVLYKVFSGGVFFLRDDVAEISEKDGGSGGLLPSFGSVAGSVSADGSVVQLSYQDRFRPEVAFQAWTAPAFADREPLWTPDLFCAISGEGLDSTCRCYTEQVTLIEEVPDAVCRKYTLHRPYNPFRALPVLAVSPSALSATDSSSGNPVSSKSFLEFPSGSSGSAVSPAPVRSALSGSLVNPLLGSSATSQ